MDAVEHYQRDYKRLRRAGAWGSATTIERRMKVHRLLVMLGRTPTPQSRRYVVLGQAYVKGKPFKERMAKGTSFDCGCWIPVEAPLYRHIEYCDRHRVTLRDGPGEK
jgi:hypothetical protein